MSIKTKRDLTMFRPQIRSRHNSHDILRTDLPLLPFRSIVRLGSVTKSDGVNRVECNSIQSVNNSSDKRLMKECFQKAGVKTAEWIAGKGNTVSTITGWATERFPIVAKHIHGSRGEGNYLIKTAGDLASWFSGKTLNNYIFEKFYSYSREYRLHITKNGCFYTCRKMLKEGTPEEQRWFRNDSNCVWIMEQNKEFDKPANWKSIEAECIKSLKAVGLDIGGFDVKVQSAYDTKDRKRENPEFIIIESNSACSFGEQTAKHYITEIPKLLRDKHKNK